jgi:molybdopterin molybdotransferase
MTMKNNALAYNEALTLTLDAIHPLSWVPLPFDRCAGLITAEGLHALADSPSANISLRDGYAVHRDDMLILTQGHPVSLEIMGTVAAGEPQSQSLSPHGTCRILTGGMLPGGTSAVVAEEDTDRKGNRVHIQPPIEPGQNILPAGADVQSGERLVAAGERLLPGLLGFLASAGHSRIPVIPTPKVAILATGDEVVSPGKPLPRGKLFASNLVTLHTWCCRYGMKTALEIVPDDEGLIVEAVDRMRQNSDALITSGGAWKSDRDLVAGALDRLGWKKVFHRIKISPGKGVGFGWLKEKPVFVLPGSPPANLVAFLEIALPGLLRLAGWKEPGLPERTVTLAGSVTGRKDWTQFVFGRLMPAGNPRYVHPLRLSSRLRSMAHADGIIAIPKGLSSLEEGKSVLVQELS